MQHFIQGFLPVSFNGVWLTNEERRPEDMQRRSAFCAIHKVILSKHPLINFPKTWLEFSNENIKILRNKIEFKTELKKHLLNDLASVVNCSRLLCPTCHLNAYCRSLLVICIFKFFFEGFLKSFLFVVMLLYYYY